MIKILAVVNRVSQLDLTLRLISLMFQVKWLADMSKSDSKWRDLKTKSLIE